MQYAGGIERCSIDLAAKALFHRKTLAGKQRFIDCREAGEHNTIDRQLFPGLDHDNVSDLHLTCIDAHLPTVTQDGSDGRGKLHELTDGITGLSLAAMLKIATKHHQREDCPHTFEVQMVMGCHMVAPEYLKYSPEAVQKACCRSNGDQTVHIGFALDQGAEALGEERGARNHGTGGEYQLQQSIRQMGKGEGEPEHRAHRQHQKEHRKDGGDDEPMAKVCQVTAFLLFLGLLVDRLYDRIPDSLYRLLDHIQIQMGLIKGNRSCFCGEVDLSLVHSLQLVERTLDSRGAGSTCHAADTYLYFFHAFTSNPMSAIRRLASSTVASCVCLITTLPLFASAFAPLISSI